MSDSRPDDRVDSDLPPDLRSWFEDLQSLREPVPELDLALAKAALGTRDLDAELVALWDSREHAEPLLRGDGDEWQLALSFGSVDVVLTVVPVGDRRRLVGVLTGDLPYALAVEWSSGRAELALDDLGRFEHEVPAGSLRLRCSGAGRSVVSDWVTA